MATTTGFIDYTEQTAPANPSASHQRLFVRSSDHLLCLVDSSGTVTPLATGTPSGSITSSGYTQNTARLLGRTTASSGAIEEITVGSGLSLSAGSLTATGGGLGHSTVGTTSIGGSFRSPTATIYLKKITLAADSLVTGIGVGVRGNGNPASLGVGVLSDSAGAPVNVIAMSRQSGSDPSAGAITNNVQLNSTARIVRVPIGAWLPAGDYWLAVILAAGGAGNIDIAYAAGTGSDKTQAVGTRFHDVSIAATSSTSDDHTIYADILS